MFFSRVFFFEFWFAVYIIYIYTWNFGGAGWYIFHLKGSAYFSQQKITLGKFGVTEKSKTSHFIGKYFGFWSSLFFCVWSHAVVFCQPWFNHWNRRSLDLWKSSRFVYLQRILSHFQQSWNRGDTDWECLVFPGVSGLASCGLREWKNDEKKGEPPLRWEKNTM